MGNLSDSRSSGKSHPTGGSAHSATLGGISLWSLGSRSTAISFRNGGMLNLCSSAEQELSSVIPSIQELLTNTKHISDGLHSHALFGSKGQECYMTLSLTVDQVSLLPMLSLSTLSSVHLHALCTHACLVWQLFIPSHRTRTTLVPLERI